MLSQYKVRTSAGFASPYNSYLSDDDFDADSSYANFNGDPYGSPSPYAGLGIYPQQRRALTEEQRRREILELERERERERDREQQQQQMGQVPRTTGVTTPGGGYETIEMGPPTGGAGYR